MIFILNTPILTAYGEYLLEGPIGPSDASDRLDAASEIESAIGHESTANFLRRLFELYWNPAEARSPWFAKIQQNRIKVEMQPGDEALVLRLLERLPEGKILSADEIQNWPYELGWLKRRA